MLTSISSYESWAFEALKVLRHTFRQCSHTVMKNNLFQLSETCLSTSNLRKVTGH
eukprot:m.5251 g.5251  ORF g.5251 m.5251 type:complete len:55 (+) comp12613_c0_seq1:138-302(+)